MGYRRVIVAILAAGLLVPVLPATIAGAQANPDVVVTGLRNPRGVHGVGTTVYVAEAGIGGDAQGDCYAPDPESPDFQICLGNSGRITGVDTATATHETVTVKTGLPSFDGTAKADNPENGMFATGPHDAWATDGLVYFPIGLGGPPAARDALAGQDARFADFARLWRTPTTPGTAESVADIAAYEASANPDGGEPDTNPYSVALESASSALLADAGGNAILRIDTTKTSGNVSTAAVLPPVLSVIPPMFGGPVAYPADPVPTAISPWEGGDFVVGQLTGFPFQTGASDVYTVDGDLSVLVEGFTNVVDVTRGPDGRLYVLQITEGSLLDAEAAFFEGNPPDFTGSLYRVDPTSGDRELILTDPLWAPGGMTFVGDDLYITNCSVCPDQDDPATDAREDGHLLRFADATAAPAIMTLRADAASTIEDDPVEVDVLANDTGTGLEITRVFGENGAAWEGSVMYQPAAHFSGTDTVAYQVCDDAGNCATGVVAVTVTAQETDRLNGEDRIGTAIEVSRALFPYGAGTVVIARADLYPDALAGSVLAATHGAPILLTRSGELDPATEAEINRLGASVAILLGGEVALSPAVPTQIQERTSVGTTPRVGGADRFATAALIKDAVETQTGEAAPSVFVAEGIDPDPRRGFPDVLSVSALAAHTTRPILLVATEVLPGPTRDALADVNAATIVGGNVAVSPAVQADIEDAIGGEADRLAGADWYETSAKAVEQAVKAGLNPKLLFLATGENWPDALVAGPSVALDGGVLMLVHPTDLAASAPTRTFLADNDPFDDIDLLGGPAAITQAVEDEIRGVLAG